MKETVLSAKTSGTATKRFEVIVEVIKKIPPKKFFCFFYAMLFLLSRNLFGFRGAGHILLCGRRMKIGWGARVGLRSKLYTLHFSNF